MLLKLGSHLWSIYRGAIGFSSICYFKNSNQKVSKTIIAPSTSKYRRKARICFIQYAIISIRVAITNILIIMIAFVITSSEF